MPAPSGPRPLRLALIVAAGALALVGIAWAALAILFPPAWLQAIVQAQLRSALAREVRFGSVSLGLFPPVRLKVARPMLAEPRGFEAGAAFQARSIQLDLDVVALLLSRRLVVQRLVLEEPALHLVRRADGSTNLDGIVRPAPPGRPQSRPMDLSIHELSIRHGRLLLDDLRAARRSALQVDARIALATERGGARFATAGETRLSDLAFGPLSAMRLSDLNRSLARLEWKIEHRGKYDGERRRLALERLALRLGGAELALAGVVDRPGPRGRFDLKARGAGVDLGDVLGYLAAADAKALHGIHGAGRLDFDLALRGSLAPGSVPAARGALRVARGAFRYPGTPAGVEDLAFTARFLPDSLRIDDLVARVGGQPARARLLVTGFADPRVWFAIAGNVDLAAVAPLLAPKDTKLGGRAALDLSGRGRAKDPGGFALDGSMRLSRVSIESPALPQKMHDVEGAVAFSQARASVSGLTGAAGRSSFRIDGTVTRPLALMAKPGTVPPAGVDFTLRSPYLDLAEVLPATPGAPVLPNASGSGRVAIARLKQQKLDVADVAARIALEPTALEVPAFSLAGYGGAVKGRARFDLTDPARPVWKLDATVDSVKAEALLGTWTPLRDLVRGSLNTTLDLAGEGAEPEDVRRTLTAVGLAMFANGTVGPGPALAAIARATRIPSLAQMRFRELRLPFHVERGRVVTEAVKLHGPTGDWTLSGAIGFDGSLDYAVSATVPPELVAGLDRKASLAAGALADEHGNLLIDLRVRGKASAPSVSWDPAAMRDRLAGRASQALAEQKAKLEEELRAATLARQKAAEDSARAAVARYRKAAEDSLRRRAGDVLKGFFSAGADTAK